MDVIASLRHLRMAPRKVRLVVDLVRGLPVEQAVLRLSFLQREAARPVLKLIKSAVANAEHNFKLDPSTLVVKSITADAGATLKRFRPRAMGRAAPIRKRTTHIFLTLAPASEATVKKTSAPKQKAVAAQEPTTTVKKAKAPRARAAKSAKTTA